MTTVLGIGFAILAIGLTVFVHELGHLLAAKKFGIEVSEFSLFFGPKIVTLGYWGETEITIRCIPLGGYCSIALSRDKLNSSTMKSLQDVRPLKQAVVILAGVFGNYCLLVLMMVIYYWPQGEPWKVLIVSLLFPAYLVTMMVSAPIAELFHFSGIIGVGHLYVQAALDYQETSSLVTFWMITVVINFSVMIMNLLPLPPLDGGRVLLVILKAVFKRDLKVFEAILTVVGTLILIGILMLTVYNDIVSPPHI